MLVTGTDVAVMCWVVVFVGPVDVVVVDLVSAIVVVKFPVRDGGLCPIACPVPWQRALFCP